MAVVKHGLAECLDLLPLTGVALYFILCGRHKFFLRQNIEDSIILIHR